MRDIEQFSFQHIYYGTNNILKMNTNAKKTIIRIPLHRPLENHTIISVLIFFVKIYWPLNQTSTLCKNNCNTTFLTFLLNDRSSNIEERITNGFILEMFFI